MPRAARPEVVSYRIMTWRVRSAAFARFPAALLVTVLFVPAASQADGLIPPLTPAQAAAAATAIQSYKNSPRGPYSRILWFCKDGTTLPPQESCREHGGGVQHAELLPQAKTFWDWNLHIGTILTPRKFEELFDAARDHHWLKELVLEKYLVEADQGWIYNKAVAYRGARQIEDEEKAGRAFLIRLLSDPKWSARNYHLAMQLIDSIPHGVEDSTVRRIRSLAAAASDADPRFLPIRAKIHSYPTPDDLKSVQTFLATRMPAEPARKALTDLAALLEQQQNPANWINRMESVKRRVGPGNIASRITALVEALRESGMETALARAAELSLDIRREVESSADGRRNLELLDLSRAVQDRAFDLRRPPSIVSRKAMIAHWIDHARMAAGGGLLSFRQLEALEAEARLLSGRNAVEAPAYRASLRYLSRSAEWCRATAARDFGPVVQHYLPVEPKAKGLIDHLLRSSAALPMVNLLEPILGDADRLAGLRHSIFGAGPSTGVTGLNPGIAIGPLYVLEPGREERIDPRGIYVIPQTAADLKPMAGILSLDSGNMLSHAQLLAANLGIPNAAIPSALLAGLESRKGKEIFFAVTPRQVVVLKEKDALSEAERRQWIQQPASAPRGRIRLDTSRLRLDDRSVKRLYEVGAKDSGVICGPKAANLGELASYFRDKVAPGLVIPFGVFQQHIARVLDGTGVTLEKRISEAVAEVERMRAAGADPAAISAYMYPRLAQFRAAIQQMPLLPEFEKEVTARMQAEFGPDGSYGVFVRSDTNAEDLPEFTGAGLNLTVPNQVGVRNILQALRNVWASPFTERAFDWRNRALIGTDRVYPSVIIQRAVPSDKSGVIATTDLETGEQNHITVNLSEGVSAVVDGGVAESLLLGPDGGVRLLQQGRATYRKTLKKTGGFENLPPLSPDSLLAAGEIAQLRALVAEVKAKYPPAKSEAGLVLPWDIEFGFEKGELRLFQIRPLVRFQEWKTLESLATLEAAPEPRQRVDLNERPQL